MWDSRTGCVLNGLEGGVGIPTAGDGPGGLSSMWVAPPPCRQMPKLPLDCPTQAHWQQASTPQQSASRRAMQLLLGAILNSSFPPFLMLLGLIQSMGKRHSRRRPLSPTRRRDDGNFAAKDSFPMSELERPTHDRRHVLHESYSAVARGGGKILRRITQAGDTHCSIAVPGHPASYCATPVARALPLLPQPIQPAPGFQAHSGACY
jgi:hypothetical protein